MDSKLKINQKELERFLSSDQPNSFRRKETSIEKLNRTFLGDNSLSNANNFCKSDIINKNSTKDCNDRRRDAIWPPQKRWNKLQTSLISTYQKKNQPPHQNSFNLQHHLDFRPGLNYQNMQFNHMTGRGRRLRKARTDQKEDFKVDVDKIRERKKTTLMIKNIPNKCTKELLQEMIDLRFEDAYDLLHLPMDKINKCNMGYAFINFKDFESLEAFYWEFHGHKWDLFNSKKVCKIAYARIQGRQLLLNRLPRGGEKLSEPGPKLN